MPLQTYTIQEAADICKCSDDTIRKDIHALTLTASKLGRAWCIKEVDLNRYIDAKSLANIRVNECHSTSEVKRGMPMSLSTDSELDNLLEPATRSKQKQSMTKSSMMQNR